MPYFANVYRVLIASPGDVLNERHVIKEVIDEWNVINSETRGIVLLPVTWETHAAPESGTKAQEVINRDMVDGCDLAIGAFWTRLGTPTDEYESGTAEEIQKMCSNGKLVMVYFSKQNLPYDHDADQFQRLKAFKEKSFSNSLVGEYASLEEFKLILFRDLSIRARKLINVDQSIAKNKIATSTKFVDGVEHTIVRFMTDDQAESLQDRAWMLTILEVLLECPQSEGYQLDELLDYVKLPGAELKLYMDMLGDREYVEQIEGHNKRYSITAMGKKYISENSTSK